MAVYVDTANLCYRSMRMSHMLADSTEELLAMADRIGLQRKWLQDGGTVREHFDVSLSLREKAIANGAIVLSRREVADLLDRRRKGWS